MNLEVIAEDFAYEQEMEYIENLGGFGYDPYEQQAASEIYQREYEGKLEELSKN